MKRVFDFVVSLVGLIILSPVFLILSIMIVADSKGGVFFRGVRVGQHGKPFKIFKFRSMRPDCEGKGKWNVGDNDERITKVGHFLRKSKLDELPQLLNVIKGDMSLVGPRPELQVYVDMYTEKEKPILDLKPGITDWASMTNFEQFKGFTQASDPDIFYLEQVRPLKLKLQLYYRYHHGFFSDIYCILYTIYKVVTRSQKLPKEVQAIVDEYRMSSGTLKEA
jgi:lipopolysaccharide/colanic/teichoic acid biosynthesis glycosyltransferase